MSGIDKTVVYDTARGSVVYDTALGECGVRYCTGGGWVYDAALKELWCTILFPGGLQFAASSF